jgi:hypothetical protein
MWLGFLALCRLLARLRRSTQRTRAARLNPRGIKN